MKTENSRPDEEEVLHAFSVEPRHDRATLEHYLNQYPEHTLALVDCSIELMMDAAHSGDEVRVSSDQVVDQAWRQFQAALESAQRTAAVANPFAQLQPTAFKSMAKRLDVSSLFLIRVRERAIDAATFPRRFVQQLAAELGATADAVSNYLRSPPHHGVQPEFSIQLEARSGRPDTVRSSGRDVPSDTCPKGSSAGIARLIMDATEAARREAERIHQAAVADGVDPWDLFELVSREAARRDLDVYALATGDSALKGGRAVLDSQAGCVLYEDVGSAFDRAFLIAHELGTFRPGER
jgi:hypothetical protein